MDIDPDRLRAILGAVGGVAVYGCVQIGALGALEAADGGAALRGRSPPRAPDQPQPI